MLSKKWIPWLVIPILLIGFAINKVMSSQRETMRRGGTRLQLKPVHVVTVKNQAFSRKIELSGHLIPYHQVELYTEVSGIVIEPTKWFKEGTVFKKGEVLIQIDDSVFRNQLMAQKSSLMNQMTLLLPDLSIDFPDRLSVWKTYLNALKLKQPLPELPEITNEQERYYIASRNIFNMFYTIMSMEATHDKYTLTAPFNGIVTESMIYPGALMRQGQKAGVFTRTGIYELEAFIHLHDLPYVKKGQMVTITTDELTGVFTGTIQRINAVIDPQSQTVKAYIIVEDARLYSGMYATATVVTVPIRDVFRIPRKLMKDENQIYTVGKDSLLHISAVKVIAGEQDSLLIQGLNDGQWIVGQPLLDAREGMKMMLSDESSERKADLQ